ncbi:hypothetical protein AAG906_039140 [Vitis piasezkii]
MSHVVTWSYMFLPLSTINVTMKRRTTKFIGGAPTSIEENTINNGTHKPSKFKVSPYIHQSNKMPKPKRFPSIVVGSQKVLEVIFLSTLESLVVAYVFDVSLDKSELLVNFQYEHASRADFLTLGPRQELLDVVILRTNSKEYSLPDATYPPHLKLATATKMFTHIIKHMDEMNDCNKIYIPMHDTCPDHWYLCVINLHQHNIHILDSLPSIERDDMRTSSVRTVVEECAHFFNLNGHLKNLSSVPIERPTWVDVWDCGVHVINHMRRSDFMDSSSTLPLGLYSYKTQIGNRITS